MKKKIIIVFSMSRSGHNAIVNWIQESYRGRSSHFNHCYKGWHDQKLITGKGNVMGDQYDGSMNQFGEPCPLEIYSIEDFEPESYTRYGMANFPIINNPDHDVYHILIIRDPYNWLASSWTKGVPPMHNHINELGFPGTRIDLYKKQMDAVDCLFKGKCTPLPKDTIVLPFNLWFDMTSGHRTNILTKLGITIDINITTDKIASESSFAIDLDKTEGQALAVLDRWRVFMPSHEHTDYWDMINNDMYYFSQVHCGFDPLLVEERIQANDS